MDFAEKKSPWNFIGLHQQWPCMLLPSSIPKTLPWIWLGCSRNLATIPQLDQSKKPFIQLDRLKKPFIFIQLDRRNLSSLVELLIFLTRWGLDGKCVGFIGHLIARFHRALVWSRTHGLVWFLNPNRQWTLCCHKNFFKPLSLLHKHQKKPEGPTRMSLDTNHL